MLCSSESNLAVAQRDLAMLLININFEPTARTDDLKSFAQQATVMAVDMNQSRGIRGLSRDAHPFNSKALLGFPVAHVSSRLAPTGGSPI